MPEVCRIQGLASPFHGHFSNIRQGCSGSWALRKHDPVSKHVESWYKQPESGLQYFRLQRRHHNGV